jgi:hypothetical protein
MMYEERDKSHNYETGGKHKRAIHSLSVEPAEMEEGDAE